MAFQCLVSLLIRNPAEVEEVLHVLFRNTFELTEAGPGTRSRVWTEWRVLPTATQTVATRNPGKLTVDSLFACQPISEWITFQNHNSNNQFASKMSPKWKNNNLADHSLKIKLHMTWEGFLSVFSQPALWSQLITHLTHHYTWKHPCLHAHLEHLQWISAPYVLSASC